MSKSYVRYIRLSTGIITPYLHYRVHSDHSLGVMLKTVVVFSHFYPDDLMYIGNVQVIVECPVGVSI